MSSNVVFEPLLVFSSLKEKPICCWITDPVAEHDVQSEGDFVDEVVHVSFETAVVVAAKDQPSFLVDPDPTRKMNRRYACEMTSRVDVTRGVLDQPQEIRKQPAAKYSRLQTAHRSELVGYIVILNPRKLVYPFSRGPW